MPKYVFQVRIEGTVRVRADNEIEARKVVPAVLLLPGPDEVKMANGANTEMGWGATITSANFRVKGDITLARVNGKSVSQSSASSSIS